MQNIDRITEKMNERTADLDRWSVGEILQVINSEDQQVAEAVQTALPRITEFTELVIERFWNGGRLFYVGSGTSGRLGVLDAAECPPTFSVPPTMVQGIIAGGKAALVRSIEGAEDIHSAGKLDMQKVRLRKKDAVLGITSSSTTPYVLSALEEARRVGAATGLLICNQPGSIHQADVIISVITGPEVITGSTRMKAGTATKMVLNMISTTAMVKLNKTYGNLMVDLQALNEKLWDRGTRLIQHFSQLSYAEAREVLNTAKGEVKPAIVMAMRELPLIRAQQLLDAQDGNLRIVLSQSFNP